MRSADIDSHITDYPKTGRAGLLNYPTETRGKHASTTVKVLCNKASDCCRIEENRVSSGIRTTTVDDLAAPLRLDRRKWIKMDIEGGEVEALKGAEKTLRRFRPCLFVEIHDTVGPVKALLDRYGHSIVREADDRSPEPHGWYQARPQ